MCIGLFPQGLINVVAEERNVRILAQDMLEVPVSLREPEEAYGKVHGCVIQSPASSYQTAF